MPILDKAIPAKNEKRMKRIQRRLKKFSFFFEKKNDFFNHSYRKKRNL
jgi:hypothetical protein